MLITYIKRGTPAQIFLERGSAMTRATFVIFWPKLSSFIDWFYYTQVSYTGSWVFYILHFYGDLLSFLFYFMLQLSCMFSKSELVFTLVNQNFMINMTEVCFIYIFTAFCNQNTMISKTINQVFYLNIFYFWFLTVQSGLELTVFIMLFIMIYCKNNG